MPALMDTKERINKMTNQELDNFWDWLETNGIATEGELQLVTSINGYNEKTLNDLLYGRTGYRSLEQYEEAECMEYEDDEREE